MRMHWRGDEMQHHQPLTALATHLFGCRDPVATHPPVTVWVDYDALQDAAILLNGPNRSHVVVITRHDDAVQAKFLVSNLEGLPENLRGIALPAILRDHNVANVSPNTFKGCRKRVTDRHA